MSALASPAILAVQLAAAGAALVVVAILRRRDVGAGIGWGVVLPLCALLVAGIVAASDPWYPFFDFRGAYYPAGRAVLHDAAALGPLLARGVDGFVNLPILAYAFAPFGALRMRDAIGLFTLAGVAATAGSWLLLARMAALDRRERWALAILFAANGPLLYGLKEGNTSAFVLFGLVAGLALLRSGRAFLAGCVLGLAAVVKLPLLLLGVFFVLRRDWRGAVGFAGVGATLGLASVAVFGWGDNLRWFGLSVVAYSRHWISAYNVQSIQAFVLRWHADGAALHRWTAVLPSGPERLAAALLTAIVCGLAALACWRTTPGRDGRTTLERQFLLVVCLALIISPLSWSHYYCWLLMPAALMLGGRTLPRGGLGWAAVLLGMPVVQPMALPAGLPTSAWTAFGSSHLLFAALAWIVALAWALARSGVRDAAPARAWGLAPGARLGGSGAE